jgi:hypothetical protein
MKIFEESFSAHLEEEQKIAFSSLINLYFAHDTTFEVNKTQNSSLG